MKSYLQQLNPETSEALVVTGGEPLLYFDNIREVFSLAPAGQHKDIMTNGTLLTQEIVDYINANNIEVHLSHDGANTKFLRGVNVFDNPKLLDLVKRIKILKVVCVMTSYNNSIKENYNYFCDVLDRDDIICFFPAMQEFDYNHYLVEGFNYDLFQKEFGWFVKHKWRDVPYYYKNPPKGRNGGLNLDLAGNVRSITSGRILGTVNDSFDELILRLEQTEDVAICNNTDCKARNRCRMWKQYASSHSCRCGIIQGDIYNE